jgi:hypothetical protein
MHQGWERPSGEVPGNRADIVLAMDHIFRSTAFLPHTICQIGEAILL